MSGNSKLIVRQAVFIAGLILSVLAGVVASNPSAPASDPQVAGFPVYKPPVRGTPVARVGGGTRGGGDNSPEVYVLTPQHMGLTSQSQPVLFWYLSRAVKARYEFVLIAEVDDEPLMETVLPGVESAGIHRIALFDLNVRLKPDVQYRWLVSVVLDEGKGSADFLASGMIEYVQPPAGIMTRIANSRGEERIGHYASAGLWYDALQSLDEMIRAGEDVTRLQQVRASLLRQVGLDAVAVFDGE